MAQRAVCSLERSPAVVADRTDRTGPDGDERGVQQSGLQSLQFSVQVSEQGTSHPRVSRTSLA